MAQPKVLENLPVPVQMNLMSQTHPGRWKQELCECSPADKCLLGCCPFAHAMARGKHDGSNCCYHFLTSPPWLTNSVLRMNYGIGTYQDCCSDLIEGYFCMPCMNRRALVEAEAFPLQTTSTNNGGHAPQIFISGHFKGVSGFGNYAFGSQQQMLWKAGGLGDCWGGCCSHTFCYALFMPQCAAARARQYLDGSDCCFNVFATSPCNVYYTARHYYGIRGQCHEDLCVSIFCYPCALDRVYREILLNTSSEVLSGCCNGCCGGVPKDKGPQQASMGQGTQGARRKGVCCC